VAGLVRTQPAGDGASDGYAAVDAMVALVILAMTITFALGAAQAARRAAVVAEETRRAVQLLRYLVDEAPLTTTIQSGVANGFTWRVQTRPTISRMAGMSIAMARFPFPWLLARAEW